MVYRYPPRYLLLTHLVFFTTLFPLSHPLPIWRWYRTYFLILFLNYLIIILTITQWSVIYYILFLIDWLFLVIIITLLFITYLITYLLLLLFLLLFSWVTRVTVKLMKRQPLCTPVNIYISLNRTFNVNH